MSDDLVSRLRSPEETVFPAGTEIAGCGGTIRTLEPFSMWSSSSDKLEAADEIERLRALNAKLQQVREAAEAWRADMALPVDHIRTGRIGCHLIAALDEVKV